jgi:hypothetical protein
MTDPGGAVRSCALYVEYENTASMKDLRIRHCPLATRPEWRTKVRAAVESEIARARCADLRFAEVGGWAIQKERRGTSEGLMMALATFGLSQMLGGAHVLTTANVAHSCSSILRRLGGSYLEFEGIPIPAYFDPRYNTEIELLRFDSRYPSTKYAGLVNMVMSKLANVSVVASSQDVTMIAPYETVSLSRPVYAA